MGMLSVRLVPADGTAAGAGDRTPAAPGLIPDVMIAGTGAVAVVVGTGAAAGPAAVMLAAGAAITVLALATIGDTATAPAVMGEAGAGAVAAGLATVAGVGSGPAGKDPVEAAPAQQRADDLSVARTQGR